MIADAEAVIGRKNFIIIVLKDKLKMKELIPELKTYMRTYTHIKASKNTNKLTKRLRYHLHKLREEHFCSNENISLLKFDV